MKRLVVLAAVGAAFAVAPTPAFATDEQRQCVPVHGPRVVIPT